MSQTKINPICRSDQTLSRYTPWYTLRSSVFFLSTSGFSEYSFFCVNIQRILKHDFSPVLSSAGQRYSSMFSSPLLSPQRDEISLPATSKALLTSLLISIISTYRRHIRRPFDGTIRRASLEYVLVPTAVSTTRRALSLPATSKALLTSLLISIISTYRSHMRQPFDGTIRRLYISHTFGASE